MDANLRHGAPLAKSVAVASDVFYSTSLHSALMAAADALDRATSVVVITGEPGCGKTLFLRLVQRMAWEQRRPVLMHLAQRRGEEAIAGLRTQVAGQAFSPVLLVDDADQFGDDGIRELLALTLHARCVQLFLAGPASLRTRLNRLVPYRSLKAQPLRIGPLMRQEVAQFVAQRCRKAKAGPVRFEQTALDCAFAISRGLPGDIEKLCACVLASNRRTIGSADIDASARLCGLIPASTTIAVEAPPRTRPHINGYRAAVAAAIGSVGFGVALLVSTVSVPHTAESSARLIRAMQPVAPTAVKLVPIQADASVPRAEPGTGAEPGSGAAIKPLPEDDAVDALILPEEERNREPDTSTETLDLNPDPEEAELEPAESAPTAAEQTESEPVASEPDTATAEEATREESIIPAPEYAETAPPPEDVARPEPAQPPAQSGTTESRSDRPADSLPHEGQPPAPVPSPATSGREPAGAVSPTVPIAQRPTIDTGPLMARGEALLREGDVAAARLFFERAAEHGDSAAMTALGRTFDPLELRRLGVLGMKGDPNRAMEWYRSAANAGDASARQSMGRLTEWIERTR